MAEEQDKLCKWHCFNLPLQSMMSPNALIRQHVSGNLYEWDSHRTVEEKPRVPHSVPVTCPAHNEDLCKVEQGLMC